jgi:predicted SnoaL-like aldol condensation-catalyzing enzyme
MNASASRKEVAAAFLRLAASGKVREAYAAHVAPGFRHHNPYFRGDRQSLLSAMEEAHVKSPNKAFEIQHALEDGEFVAVHSRVTKQDMVIGVVHLFRFEDQEIAELWDIASQVPKDSPNENGMF